MERLLKNSILFCAVLAMAVVFTSCLDGGSSSRSTGTLDLSLIDDSASYYEVVVTISEVQVHHESEGWKTLSGSDLNVPMQVNLLDLVNGSMAYIGASELQPGHYDQMRLILDSAENANYIVVKQGDLPENLKIPSGFQTGIKLVRGFDIAAAGSTELILDFDVDKSIVKAGNSGKYILKPTIKVVDTVTNSVSGIVRDDGTGDPLGGAHISAQRYDAAAINEADSVMVAAGTTSSELSAELGQYSMYLPLLPPTAPPYSIVATMEGYLPACVQLPDNEGRNITGEYTRDFNLVSNGADPTVTFTATIENLPVDASVTISIRQDNVDCGWIEIATFNRGNVASDPLVTLPAGTYRVFVTSEDVDTSAFIPKDVAATDSSVEILFQ